MPRLQTNRGRGRCPRTASAMEPAAPLWQRVPTRDENGELLADFLMLIPRLGKRSKAHISATIAQLERVLHRYGDAIVFADLNLRLNTLWISLRPRCGLCLEIATCIKLHVPEAVLVAERQQ